MKKHTGLFRGIYAALFCLLIAVSLCIQFIYGFLISGGLSYIVLFVSYFTIVSNVFVAFVLGREAYTSFQGHLPSIHFERMRAAAVFCIVTTGIIYSLFLKGPGGQGAVQDSLPWINSVFHYIVPAVMTLDWLFYPTQKAIPWYSIAQWIGLTLIYLIYVEILGFYTKTYPYFFLNPLTFHGYSGVLRASITFVPFFIVFGAIVVGINRLRLKFF